VALGLPLWWITGRASPLMAVCVGYGSHLFADMMTLSGVRLFWPSRVISVFPGRDDYRVRTGGNSERLFVAFALLFYPVSRVGFEGLIYRLGGSDQLYGRVTEVTDGDTITVEIGGRSTPVRLIGLDTPETLAPDQPIGCYGKRASDHTRRVLAGRIVRLEIPPSATPRTPTGAPSPTSTWTPTATGPTNTSTTRTSSSWGWRAPPPSPTPTAASSSGCGRRPRNGAPGCGAPVATPPGARSDQVYRR
jgi:hypothetical protein